MCRQDVLEKSEVRTSLENNDTDRRRGGRETKKTMAWSGRGKKPPSFRVIKNHVRNTSKEGKSNTVKYPKSIRRKRTKKRPLYLGLVTLRKISPAVEEACFSWIRERKHGDEMEIISEAGLSRIPAVNGTRD